MKKGDYSFVRKNVRLDQKRALLVNNETSLQKGDTLLLIIVNIDDGNTMTAQHLHSFLAFYPFHLPHLSSLSVLSKGIMIPTDLQDDYNRSTLLR